MEPVGIHSTFFGPLKYNVLTDHLSKRELVGGNGFVESGTFISILIGTIVGNYYNINNNTIITLSFYSSVIGLISSYFIPLSNNSNKDLVINYNIIDSTKEILQYAKSKRNVYLAILGISWFWFIGAVILTQLSNLTKHTLGADENVNTLFLASFSIGVGIGSFWCHKIFKGQITTKYIFICAFAITILCVDLFISTKIASIKEPITTLKSIEVFLAKPHRWRIIIDLFILAIVSGLYVVPLYAIIQHYSAPIVRSRVIAANNFINAIFMCGSSIILALLTYIGITIPYIILILGIANLLISFIIYKNIDDNHVMPNNLWRTLFRFMFNSVYKVKVKGLENYYKTDKRTVIVPNHLSYLDPGLIAAYMPESIKFAINKTVAQKWWVKPFLQIVDTFPVDQTHPMAIKSLIEQVKKRNKIAIFPEGRTSDTGSLMKIYEGPAMVADKSGASILPIRVDGTEFTIFSRLRSIMTNGFSFRRTITITVLPPVKITPKENLSSRQRRKFMSERLYDIMSDMVFESSNKDETLFKTFIDSSAVYGSKSIIAEDINGVTINYRNFILKSFIVANFFKEHHQEEQRIGLMIPNTVTSIVTMMGMSAAGKTVAMINFTSGAANIINSANITHIKNIYTAKAFIEKAELKELVSDIKKAGINIIYLEDIKEKITLTNKIKSFFFTYTSPLFYYENYLDKNHTNNVNKEAIILFTSGTEGTPKAVALSHRNIQSNKCQVNSRIDLTRKDIAFNCLPLFHSFGITATLLMLFRGIKVFFYPSPLHYRIIPEVIYDTSATILFGTDTFLNGYANAAHPYDFYSLRYVVAGAERLKENTRKIWLEKFGIRIFEGYGATEASPVISVNTPMHNKQGSVGRLVPKIEYQIRNIPGIENGGKLLVKGPNIMLGYITNQSHGRIIHTYDEEFGNGWYDTGDIVTVDEEKYVTIIGRVKRFAKIAGEMVSLAAIEEIINDHYVDNKSAIISIADNKKGQQLVLFTTNKDLSRKNIIEIIKEKKLPELYVPKHVFYIKEIPLLASGKVDFNYVNNILEKDFKDKL
ncbi:MAG TPA: acyl-[ACP]--phospholipid O-acyltransferase [Candidatus Megaira endosymbiont of Hartmannula sinica]|nr:acyl-[ACP]--phospholipid O-acyltransferase [Candidatus Megaera endosymbiont of Hartmannula sinica]